MGESGCGKSSLGLTLLRLLPKNGEVVGGSIRLGEQELLQLTDEKRFAKASAGTKMSMVFQGAMNALNPVLTVGSQIAEAILAHEQVSKEEAVAAGQAAAGDGGHQSRPLPTTTRTSSAAA